MPEDDSSEVVQTPFDRLLSRTLMQKESAQELVRSHLPPEFVAHLKPETLEQADTSFIDANLKRRFADRLFKVEMIAETARELGMESPHVHLLVLVDQMGSNSFRPIMVTEQVSKSPTPNGTSTWMTCEAME